MMITTYRDHHFDGVDRLWRECFPNDPPRNRAEFSIPAKHAIGAPLGSDLIVVALDDDDTVIGTIMAGYDGHRGWLYAVAVAANYRRSGIGRRLVKEACQRLRNVGCAKVNLQIRAGNEAVTAFYQSLGFEVEPRISMGRLL